MDAELERKLRDIVERDEIWSMLLRYSRGIDRFDRDLVRSCYWDDATDDHHNFAGNPDDFLDKYVWPYHGTYQTLHHHGLSNHTCELAGDEAHCETYYTFIGTNKEPPHMLSIGRYIDHLQKRGGEWKIAARVCTIEAVYKIDDMPGYIDVPIAGAPPALYAGRDKGDLSYMRPIKPRQPPKAG